MPVDAIVDSGTTLAKGWNRWQTFTVISSIRTAFHLILDAGVRFVPTVEGGNRVQVALVIVLSASDG